MGKKISWNIEELNKLPSSVGDAIALGLKFYYNGNLCKEEHLCARTIAGKCYACTRQKAKIRYESRSINTVKNKLNSNRILHGLSNSIEQKIYNSARHRARKKGLEFNISVNDIKIPEYCPILHIKIEKHWGGTMQNSKLRFNKPSLDRINSEKGYIKGNINVISYRANMIKGNGTADEHKKIAQFLRDNIIN